MSTRAACGDTTRWSTQDQKKLLGAVLEVTGSNNTKSFKTVESSITWENVKVEGKSAEECKAMYHRLISKVRKFRIMPEVIVDAVALLEGPVKSSEYPDIPKKPPTAFSLFVMKRSKKYPDVKSSDRMKVFSADWNKLSEEKKEKYKKKYLKLKKKYEEELEIFRQNHPDCPLPGTSNSRPNPPLPSKLFVESRIEKIKSKNPELSNAEAVKLLMNKYKELSDKKKLKWIKRAMSCRQTYQDQVDVYLSHNPKPLTKPALLHLSKEEERIWLSSRGKPVPAPPKNVFNYFCNAKRDTVHHLSISEQSRTLSALYHKLTAEEVKDLTEAFRKEVEEYVQAYTVYYNSLPEEEQSEEKSPEEALAVYMKILQDDQKKKKKKKASSTADANQKKVDLPKPTADSVNDHDDDSDFSLPSSGKVAPAKRKSESHVDPETPRKKRKHDGNPETNTAPAQKSESHVDPATPKKKLKHDSISETNTVPAQKDELDEDALLSMWTPQKSNGAQSSAEDVTDTLKKSKSPKKARKSKA